ncbi:hypothetical protein BDZ94DRAFT_1293776 [Collybia nuda]|uniref:Uncharacterized protein n=1 Tax=Collybia nuda TaxID=64659 RepID=A0A9P5YGA6_9AGAR|nr:hypothetical protein BDZ94DRAFT_1293776 [Collybia nuda]
MFWQLGPRWMILFIFLRGGTAAQFNRTIDDTLGDSVTGEKPIYLPTTVGVWQNADCKGCLLQPDRILAFNGTWTAATYTPTLESMSVELAFKGTAIYVFFILANIVERDNPTETECNFTLDGRLVGNFQHTPISTNEFLFDSLVFSQDNLSNVDHRLSILTSSLDHKVWVNFDYALYTTDDTPARPLPSSSSSPLTPVTSSTSTGTPLPNAARPSLQIGVIVGSVVGGLIALLLLVLILLFWHRRRQPAEKDDDEFPTALSPLRQYNDSNVRFVTPFTNYHTRHSLGNSELHQSLATFPLRSEAAARASSHFVDAPHYQSNIRAPMNPSAFRREKNQIPIITSSGAGRSPPSFAPPMPDPDPLQEHTTEATRRERQAEIGRQMDALKQNMRYLKAVDPFHQRPTQGQRGRGEDVLNMRDEIQALREQINYLQAQQQSSWAQGLSDEPPPSYSASPPIRLTTRFQP